LIVAPAGIVATIEVTLSVGIAGALIFGSSYWDEKAG